VQVNFFCIYLSNIILIKEFAILFIDKTKPGPAFPNFHSENKSSDRHPNRICVVRPHHFHDFAVQHNLARKATQCGHSIGRAAAALNFKDVAVFSCLGWQFKLSVEPPSGRFSAEKAPSLSAVLCGSFTASLSLLNWSQQRIQPETVVQVKVSYTIDSSLPTPFDLRVSMSQRNLVQALPAISRDWVSGKFLHRQLTCSTLLIITMYSISAGAF
jgi:hypothetical protein